MSDESKFPTANYLSNHNSLTSGTNNNSNNNIIQTLVQCNPLHQTNCSSIINNDNLSVHTTFSLSSSPTLQLSVHPSQSGTSSPTLDHNYHSNCWVKLSECDEFIGINQTL
jgi:hypothetical protein